MIRALRFFGTFLLITHCDGNKRPCEERRQVEHLGLFDLDFAPLAIDRETWTDAHRRVAGGRHAEAADDSEAMQIQAMAMTRPCVVLLLGNEVILEQQLAPIIKRLLADQLFLMHFLFSPELGRDFIMWFPPAAASCACPHRGSGIRRHILCAPV